MADGGHVFVIHGDIFKLDCDAWLLPTDNRGTEGIEGTWLGDGRLQKAHWKPVPAGWAKGGTRTHALERVSGTSTGPQPFLTNIGAAAGADPSWFVDGAVAFVEHAADWVRANRDSEERRSRGLVALPLVGTEHGGGARRAGEIAKHLLPKLQEAASRSGVDVVLVAFRASAYAAAQRARRADSSDCFWPSLSGGDRKRADGLAARAAKGDLVLFLGAGVSMSAGLPGWRELLDRVAAATGVDAAELRALDPLDQAEVLKRKCGEEELQARVVDALQNRHGHSLTHALLACLPVKEVVTTNYDGLYELAAERVVGARGLAILGRDSPSEGKRWLLKMHGSVDRPESIVLTRTDYLEYAEARGALMGIVQALLMTRHMLFVGFSKDDPNFHRIIHAVVRALPKQSDGAPLHEFGTTLEVERSQMRAELWKQQLEIVDFGADRDIHAASRHMNVFLDRLCATVPHTAHLVDEDFADLLSEGERRIVDLVRKLEEESRLHEGLDAGLRRRIEELVSDMRG